jgi:serine/threonine protein kinase
MDDLYRELENFSLSDLKRIAIKFGINNTSSKSKLIKYIYARYCDVKKYIGYTYLRQLGMEGKDGRTFLALDDQNNEVAIKIFRKTKSSSSIDREVKLQQIAASHGLSPKVIEYNSDGKYIVMEKLDVNLFDCFKQQHGQLTLKQQKSIIRLFKKLDTCKVFHGDPNPLNFMMKNGSWYIIDFGFAKPINERTIIRYGTTPNITYMPLGFLLKLRKVYDKTTLEYIVQYTN